MTDSGLNTKKLCLKSFLKYGLTFGLIMTLWKYIDEGKVDIEKIIFISVAFGLLMSWTTVSTQKKRFNKSK